jgi:hypothetical protein
MEVFFMTYVQNLLNSFFNSIPSVISAILILILAFLVAFIAKVITTSGLKKFKADKYTDKLGLADEKTGSSIEFIGKLVFFIVFLLFLPGALDRLGMQNVSRPISELVSTFLNFIPNLLVAVIILVIGFFIANIIRQLLKPILVRLRVDKLQEKAGIEAKDSTTISSVLSYVVYILILIPVVIAALQALRITAISEPAIMMLNKILLFLPNIFVAIGILIVGIFISRIAANLLIALLAGVGADTLLKKIAPKADADNIPSLSKIIGESVRYIIILLFVVEAINVLQLDVLQFVGAAIIAYLPFAISALIIIGLALLLTTWVESLIRKNFPKANLSIMAAKTAIMVLAAFMVFNQLGIAQTIVNTLFIIVLSAIAIAFAIAFGVGGRQFAANMLKKAESKIDEETSDTPLK